MICKPIKSRSKLMLNILAITLAIIGYSILSILQHHTNPTETTVPNLHQFFQGIYKIFQSDINGKRWIVEDSCATGSRFLMGISIGISLSIVLGLLIGCYEWLAAFFLPLITALAKVPATAALAVYFAIFGTETPLFLAIIALGILPPMTISIYGAVKNDVHNETINKSYTLGASEMETIWEVVFKQILPRILQNIQLAIGPAMVYVIASEWVMADIGFGYRLRMQSRLLNMNVVYIYLGFLVFFGFIMDRSLVLLRRKLCPWFGD